MTKKEIVREVSAQYGIDQGLAKQIVQFVLDSIVRSLEKEGRIELRNFGVFEVKRRAARVARNPRTNEPCAFPPKQSCPFSRASDWPAWLRSSLRPRRSRRKIKQGDSLEHPQLCPAYRLTYAHLVH